MSTIYFQPPEAPGDIISVSSILSSVRNLYTNVKGIKSEGVSKLRKISKMDSAESRRTNDVNRFIERSELIQSNLNSYVNSAVNEVNSYTYLTLDADLTTIKRNLQSYKSQIDYLRNTQSPLLSNKDYSEAQLYFNFIDEYILYMDTKRQEFFDGRLTDLNVRYGAKEQMVNSWMSKMGDLYINLIGVFNEHRQMVDSKTNDEWNRTIYNDRFNNFILGLDSCIQEYNNTIANIDSQLAAGDLDQSQIDSLNLHRSIVSDAIIFIQGEHTLAINEKTEYETTYSKARDYYDERISDYLSTRSNLMNVIQNAFMNMSDDIFESVQGINPSTWWDWKKSEIRLSYGIDTSDEHLLYTTIKDLEYSAMQESKYFYGPDRNRIFSDDFTNIGDYFTINQMGSQLSKIFNNSNIEGKYAELNQQIFDEISNLITHMVTVNSCESNLVVYYSEIDGLFTQIKNIDMSTMSSIQDYTSIAANRLDQMQAKYYQIFGDRYSIFIAEDLISSKNEVISNKRELASEYKSLMENQLSEIGGFISSYQTSKDNLFNSIGMEKDRYLEHTSYLENTSNKIKNHPIYSLAKNIDRNGSVIGWKESQGIYLDVKDI